MSNLTLKSRLKSSITIFLSNLHLLSAPITSVNHLSEILLVIHGSFKKILNWISVSNKQISIKTVKLTKVENNSLGDSEVDNSKKQTDLLIYRYESKDCLFSIILHKKYGLIQVDTGLIQMNIKVFDHYLKTRDETNRKLSTGSENLKENTVDLLTDDEIIEIVGKIELFLSLYTDYKTRLCDYCLGTDFPEERSLEKDYVSAYHSECKEREIQL